MRRSAIQVTAAVTALLLGTAAGATARSGPRTVATTASASGSNLYVMRYADSSIAPLRKGDRIYFGDIVSAGPGSAAKLDLAAVPKGTDGSTDLFDVYKETSAGQPVFVARQFGVLAAATHLHKTVTAKHTGASLTVTLGG